MYWSEEIVQMMSLNLLIADLSLPVKIFLNSRFRRIRESFECDVSRLVDLVEDGIESEKSEELRCSVKKSNTIS